MLKKSACFSLLTLLTVVSQAHAGGSHSHAHHDNSFLPKNDLHLAPHENFSGVTEAEFQEVLTHLERVYSPVFATFGAQLNVIRDWENPTVNASAFQTGNIWNIRMYGGLARSPQVTPDGFTAVACHELGHHVGGYLFYGDFDWASTEGQSDYFATHACLRKLWAPETEKNSLSRSDVNPYVKEKCDAVWGRESDQNLCYRIAGAGESLAALLASLNNSPTPRFETPSQTVVSENFLSHPDAQCRLDTYLAGALCAKPWDDSSIPGAALVGARNSKDAEIQAARNTCNQATGDTSGFRPRCWFKPQLNSQGLDLKTVRILELRGNKDGEIGPEELGGLVAAFQNLRNVPHRNARLTPSTSAIGVSIDQSPVYLGDIAPGKTVGFTRPLTIYAGPESCGASVPVKLTVNTSEGVFENTHMLSIGPVTSFESIASYDFSESVEIPDLNDEGVSFPLEFDATGQADSIRLSYNTTHSYPSDLEFTVTSPSGKLYKLKSANAPMLADGVLQFRIPRESVQGVWRFKVADRVAADVGTLDSWKFEVLKAQCR